MGKFVLFVFLLQNGIALAAVCISFVCCASLLHISHLSVWVSCNPYRTSVHTWYYISFSRRKQVSFFGRGIDISVPALSLLEGQKRPVSDFELCALADALHVSVDWLWGRN